MRSGKKIIISVCMMLLGTEMALAKPICAEKSCRDVPTWWMNLGVGAGTTLSSDTQGGLGVHLSFNGTLTEHIALTLYDNGVFFSSNDSTDDSIIDKGILLGYVDRHEKGFWSLSTGIAYYEKRNEINYSYSYGNYNRWGTYVDKESGAGLPVQGQAFWTPFRHFGIGVIGHALVVPKPYVTGLLAFQIT